MTYTPKDGDEFVLLDAPPVITEKGFGGGGVLHNLAQASRSWFES
jgi:hypothetical protein